MVSFDNITNTPPFHSAPECFHYQKFALTYDILEACHITCEETIMLPDMRQTRLCFIADDNLLWGSEGAQNYIPSTVQVNQSNKATQSKVQIGSLTFDLKAPSNEVELQAAHSLN